MLSIQTERLLKAFLQAAVFLFLAALLSIGANSFRSDGIALVADWSPDARLTAATGDSLVIPLDLAASFYDAREAVFVDARPVEQFAEGHIPGALSVPWENVDEYIGLFLEKVPDPDTIVITYCDGKACALSEDLALMLRDMGYTHVKVLVNGWTVWTEAGYPVEKGTWKKKSEG